MTIIAALTLVAALGLSWSNGTNDVSKGVATLVGGGRATYRIGGELVRIPG